MTAAIVPYRNIQIVTPTPLSGNGGQAINNNFIVLADQTAGLSTSITSTSTALSTHAALTAAHGTTGSVVGTSDTQTLTQKTITDATNNLSASILTSGTVPTARLGSGTASSSTFLRGDQTWATITSGAVSSVTNGNGLTLSGGTLSFSSSGYAVLNSSNSFLGSITAPLLTSSSGTINSNLSGNALGVASSGMLFHKITNADQGIVAAFNFDEGTGTSSSTSNGSFTATLSGGATWDYVSNDLSGTPSGSSLKLNGSTAYASVTGLLDTLPSAFSVSLLFKPASTISPGGSGSGQNLFSKCYGNTFQNGFRVWIDDWSGGQTGKLYFNFNIGGTGYNIATSQTTWLAGVTYKVTVDIGPAGTYLRINGVIVGTIANQALPSAGSPQPFTIGNYNYNGTTSTVNGFNGTIDEVVITNFQPTVEQCHQMYNHTPLLAGVEQSGKLAALARTTIIPPSGSTWQANGTLEPNVIWDSVNQKFRMWYTGLNGFNGVNGFSGSTIGAIGYAESTDGSTWTQYGQVIGAGVGGESGAANGSYTIAVPTRYGPTSTNAYWLYYQSGYSGAPLRKIVLASDGHTITSGPTTVISATAISGVNGMSNPCIYDDGSTLHMLSAPYYNGSPSTWKAAYCYCTDTGTGGAGGATWTFGPNSPLNSMSFANGTTFDPRTLTKINGIWHAWGQISYSLNFPTPITHWTNTATSPGSDTWVADHNDVVMTVNGETFSVNSSTILADQVADPRLVEITNASNPSLNGTWIFYDYDVNPNQVTVGAQLAVAKYDGTLANLVTDYSPLVIPQNRFLASPLNGSGAPVIRSLVSSDLPAAPTYLGTIFSATSFANLNAFSANNLTATTSSGKINISNATPNFFNTTLDLANYTTALPRWRQTMNFVPGTPGAATYGAGLILRCTNQYGNTWSLSGWVRTDTSVTGGQVTLTYIPQVNNGGANPTSIVNSGTNNLAFSSTDTLSLSFERIDDTFIVSCYNVTTQSLPVTVSYKMSISHGTSFVMPNRGVFGIACMGGSQTVSAYSVDSITTKGADIAFIGDSKTAGNFAGDYSSSFASLIQNNYRSITLAGPSDGTREVLAALPETIALSPQTVILNIGRNDITALGLTTTETNYSSIVSQLQAAGIVVYHLLPLYESAFDQSGLTSWIISTYPNAYIDAQGANYAGTASNVLDSDTVHPNPFFHVLIYKAILHFFSLRNPLAASYQLGQSLASTYINGTLQSIGSYVSSSVVSGSAVTLTSGSPSNVTSITLGPGDWDVSGVVDFLPGSTTTTTYLQGAFSTTSGGGFTNDTFFSFPFALIAPGVATIPCPTTQFVLQTTTTLYLVANAGFSTSTLKAYGTLRARRMR